MYKHYYINTNMQANGDHEVHHSECYYLPEAPNRIYLGLFNSSFDAIKAAKQRYPHWLSINGCAFCCPESHTR